MRIQNYERKDGFGRYAIISLIILVIFSSLLAVNSYYNRTFRENLSFLHDFGKKIAQNITTNIFKLTTSEEEKIKIYLLTCNGCVIDEKILENTNKLAENVEIIKKNYPEASTVNITNNLELETLPVIGIEKKVDLEIIKKFYSEPIEEKNDYYLLKLKPQYIIKKPEFFRRPFVGSGNNLEIIYFIDFNDLKAKDLFNFFPEIIKKFPQIRINFKHLAYEKEGFLKNLAMQCAFEQGAFLNLSEKIFSLKNNEEIIQTVKNIATVDFKKFSTCFSDIKTENLINEDFLEANKFSLDKNRNLLINGKIKENITEKNLTELIQTELFTDLLKQNKKISFGKEDSKIKIIEYSDFSCPFCKEYNLKILPQIKKNFGDKIYYLKKDFLLSDRNENALLMARIARCSDKKYWEISNYFYNNQELLTKEADILEFLKENKVIDEKIVNCVSEDKTLEQTIYFDFISALEKGVSSIPALIIFDGNKVEKIEGVLPYKDLERYLNEKLK